MNSLSHDTALSAPHHAAIPLDRARWFKEEVHSLDTRLKSYLRGSFPSVDVEDVVQESYLRTWLAS